MATLVEVTELLRKVNLNTADTWRKLHDMQDDNLKFYKGLFAAMNKQAADQKAAFESAALEGRSDSKFGGDGDKGGDDKKKADAAAGGLVGLFTGISALTVGIFGIVNRWNSIRSDFDEAQQKIYRSIEGFVAAINPMRVIKGLRLGFTLITGGLTDLVANRIKTAITGIFGNIGKGFANSKLGKAVSSAFSGISKAMRPVTAVVRFMGRIIGLVASVFRPIMSFAGNIIRLLGRFSGAFTVVIALFDGVMAAWSEYQSNGMSPEVVLEFVRGFISSFTRIFESIGQVLGWVVERVLLLFGVSEERAAGIRASIEGVFSSITNALNTVLDFFINLWRPIIDFFVAFVSGDGEGMRAAIGEYFGVITDTIASVLDFFGVTDMEWLTGAIDMLRNTWDAVIGAITGQIERVTRGFRRIGRFFGFGEEEGPAVETGLQRAERIAAEERQRRDEEAWIGETRTPSQMAQAEQEQMMLRRTAQSGQALDRTSREVSNAQVTAQRNMTIVDSSQRNTTNVSQNTSTQIAAQPRPRNARDVSMRGRFMAL